MSSTSMDSTDVGTAIANEITRLHREYHGRGAASARTIMGGNHVAVFLEDIYTTSEQTLIDAGRFPAVSESRQAFQQAMRPAFIKTVEDLTGRAVVAFMSQVHDRPGIAVEAFVLARWEASPMPA